MDARFINLDICGPCIFSEVIIKSCSHSSCQCSVIISLLPLRPFFFSERLRDLSSVFIDDTLDRRRRKSSLEGI